MRHDRRNEDELRSIKIETNVLKHPEGSVLVSFGDTKVICAATIENKVPHFLKGQGTGWVTAEYSMLPRATNTRNKRESSKGKVSGRTMEIQRLIGRSLRAVVDLEKLGEHTLIVDCDVIQADGGTRTASITGAFVAMKLAFQKLLAENKIQEDPTKEHLAAVSVGILPDGSAVLDLDYKEDFAAHVDMNIVMTESGRFVEIQGTGEEATFSGNELNTLLFLGSKGIEELIGVQKNSLNYYPEDEQSLGLENEIVIATRNPGKVKEFVSMFSNKGMIVKSLLDFPDIPDVEETGATFEENARLKAETIARYLNRPVLADDSGLIVDALSGQPGVYSARFAGEGKGDAANNAKLLYELTDFSDEKKTARFHCTLVLAQPQGESICVTGEVEGMILSIPRGDNGFGYDPLFYLVSEGKTMAELSDKEKNKLSHRAKAIQEMNSQWDSWKEMGKFS